MVQYVDKDFRILSMRSGVETTVFALALWDPTLIRAIWSESEEQTTQCGNAKEALVQGILGERSQWVKVDES